MVRKLVVDVPDDLKEKFKIACMKNGTSIHATIIEFMQETLDGREDHAEPTENSPLEAAAQVSPLPLKKTTEFDVRAFRNALNLEEKKTLPEAADHPTAAPHHFDPDDIGF